LRHPRIALQTPGPLAGGLSNLATQGQGVAAQPSEGQPAVVAS